MLGNRSRYRYVWREHIFPFGGEVHPCCDILFPRFHIQRISVGHRIILVKILVRESTETVSELMDDHRFEHGMMRSGQRVGIVDSSSAVYIRVGEDNNMLIGDSRQRIVDRFHPAGSQITFGIERVEM